MSNFPKLKPPFLLDGVSMAKEKVPIIYHPEQDRHLRKYFDNRPKIQPQFKHKQLRNRSQRSELDESVSSIRNSKSQLPYMRGSQREYLNRSEQKDYSYQNMSSQQLVSSQVNESYMMKSTRPPRYQLTMGKKSKQGTYLPQICKTEMSETTYTKPISQEQFKCFLQQLESEAIPTYNQSVSQINVRVRQVKRNKNTTSTEQQTDKSYLKSNNVNKSVEIRMIDVATSTSNSKQHLADKSVQIVSQSRSHSYHEIPEEVQVNQTTKQVNNKQDTKPMTPHSQRTQPKGEQPQQEQVVDDQPELHQKVQNEQQLKRILQNVTIRSERASIQITQPTIQKQYSYDATAKHLQQPVPTNVQEQKQSEQLTQMQNQQVKKEDTQELLASQLIPKGEQSSVQINTKNDEQILPENESAREIAGQGQEIECVDVSREIVTEQEQQQIAEQIQKPSDQQTSGIQINDTNQNLIENSKPTQGNIEQTGEMQIQLQAVIGDNIDGVSVNQNEIMKVEPEEEIKSSHLGYDNSQINKAQVEQHLQIKDLDNEQYRLRINSHSINNTGAQKVQGNRRIQSSKINGGVGRIAEEQLVLTNKAGEGEELNTKNIDQQLNKQKSSEVQQSNQPKESSQNIVRIPSRSDDLAVSQLQLENNIIKSKSIDKQNEEPQIQQQPIEIQQSRNHQIIPGDNTVELQQPVVDRQYNSTSYQDEQISNKQLQSQQNN